MEVGRYRVDSQPTELRGLWNGDDGEAMEIDMNDRGARRPPRHVQPPRTVIPDRTARWQPVLY